MFHQEKAFTYSSRFSTRAPVDQISAEAEIDERGAHPRHVRRVVGVVGHDVDHALVGAARPAVATFDL